MNKCSDSAYDMRIRYNCQSQNYIARTRLMGESLAASKAITTSCGDNMNKRIFLERHRPRMSRVIACGPVCL